MLDERRTAAVAALRRRARPAFTENDTNTRRLYGSPTARAYTKDAFHRYVMSGDSGAVNPARHGTKAAAHYVADASRRARRARCVSG